MGRKTYESIGRPLPKRKTIILTTQQNFVADKECLVANSVEEALELAKNVENFSKDELFIIGGGQIYDLFLPIADKLYLTQIDNDFDADTYFPEVTFKNWTILEQSEKHIIPDNYSWSVSVWQKKIY